MCGAIEIDEDLTTFFLMKYDWVGAALVGRFLEQCLQLLNNLGHAGTFCGILRRRKKLA